ncbi:MAG: hypothetical protein ACREL1_06745 [bacterium]
MGLVISLSGASCGPKKVTGEYDVTGSGGAYTASVTFASPTQSNAQAISVTLPWTYSFPATITEGSFMGTYVYLYAQNDSGSGTVTVTIKENDNVFQQGTTTGGFPAAVSVLGTF